MTAGPCAAGVTSRLAIGVAPMIGVTTFPTRLWLAMASKPTVMTTPFLKVTRVHPTRQLPDDYAPELSLLRGALPYSLTPQLLAGEPDCFMRAAALLPPEVAPTIELNCGCPSPNGMSGEAGSEMLRSPERFGRVIGRLARELGPGRLAVKMRLGCEDAGEAEALLAAIFGLPLARLTLHARTRRDGYRGKARWEDLAKARASVPLWASGDVLGPKSLQQLQATASNLSGVIIGRGLLRNPWVFQDLHSSEAAAVAPAALLHCLMALALLDYLWITAPAKILARVARGKLGAYCGRSPERWEEVVAELSSLAWGVPMLAVPGARWQSVGATTRVLARLRWLWQELAAGLGEAGPAFKAVGKARTLEDFVAAFTDGAQRQGRDRGMLLGG